MSVRVLSVALLAMAASALCACGGGSGSSLSSSTSGSSSGSSATSNTLAITIDGGSAAIVQADGIIPNFAYVSVTICANGSTSNCQSIDHVQIDTH
ncbi:MAG: DUF3443 family protein, partial [Steroidobacteraceae bacterium]